MLLNSTPNENGVLVVLPPNVRVLLMQKGRLEAGDTLYDIDSIFDRTWFITSGIVSLLTTTEAGEIIEAIAVGRELAISCYTTLVPDNKLIPIGQAATSTNL